MKLEEIIKTYLITKIKDTVKIESQRINRRFFEIRKIEDLWDKYKNILEDKESLTIFIGSLNIVTFPGSYNYSGICDCCSKKTEFVSIGRGFKKYCNKQCEKNIKEQINIILFGGKSPMSDKDVREKVKQTNIERYGGNTPMSCELVKEKVKQTNIERYGVENVFQYDAFKEKSNNTRFQRYGYTYTLQNPKNLLKIKEYFTNNGKWYNYDNLDDKVYYNKLIEFNQRKFAKEINNLNNYDKRGFYATDYHLDHMFSKYEGFIQCILPYYIGHICNLTMLEGPKNISKGKNCSLSKDELFERIDNYNKIVIY